LLLNSDKALPKAVIVDLNGVDLKTSNPNG
jgi:hypothetical protein